jgi:dipeptidase
MNPVSCDTFVVLPPLTAHGGVIFGKNSDRPKGEVQELIYQPAQQYTPGEQLQVNNANCIPSSQLEKVKVYRLLLKNVWGALDVPIIRVQDFSN